MNSRGLTDIFDQLLNGQISGERTDIPAISGIRKNVWRLLAVGLSKHQLSITSNVYLKIQMFFSEGK